MLMRGGQSDREGNDAFIHNAIHKGWLRFMRKRKHLWAIPATRTVSVCDVEQPNEFAAWAHRWTYGRTIRARRPLHLVH